MKTGKQCLEGIPDFSNFFLGLAHQGANFLLALIVRMSSILTKTEEIRCKDSKYIVCEQNTIGQQFTFLRITVRKGFVKCLLVICLSGKFSINILIISRHFLHYLLTHNSSSLKTTNKYKIMFWDCFISFTMVPSGM